MRLFTVHRGPLAFLSALCVVLLLAFAAVRGARNADVTTLLTHHEAFAVQPNAQIETRLPAGTQPPSMVTERLDSLTVLPGVNVEQRTVPSGTDDPILTIDISVVPAALTAHSVADLSQAIDEMPGVIDEAGLGNRGVTSSGELSSALERVQQDLTVMRNASLLATVTITGLALTILAGAVATYVSSRREIVSLCRARGATLTQTLRLTLPVPIIGVLAPIALLSALGIFVPTVAGLVDLASVWGATSWLLLAWTCAVAFVVSIDVHTAAASPQSTGRKRSLRHVIMGALLVILAVFATWRLLSQRFDATTVIAPTVLILSAAVLCAVGIIRVAQTTRGRSSSASQHLAVRQISTPSITGFAISVTAAVVLQFVLVMTVVSASSHEAEKQYLTSAYPADVQITVDREAQAVATPAISTASASESSAFGAVAVTQFSGRLGRGETSVTALPWPLTSTVLANDRLSTVLTNEESTAKVAAARQWPLDSDHLTVTVDAELAGINLRDVDLSLTTWLMNDAGDVVVLNDKWETERTRDGRRVTWSFKSTEPLPAGTWYMVGTRVSPSNMAPTRDWWDSDASGNWDPEAMDPELSDVHVSLHSGQLPVSVTTVPSVPVDSELSTGSVSNVAVVLNAKIADTLDASAGDTVQLDAAGARFEANIVDIVSPDDARSSEVLVDSLSIAAALIDAGSVPRVPTDHWMSVAAPRSASTGNTTERYHKAQHLLDELTQLTPDFYAPAASRLRPPSTGLYPTTTVYCSVIVALLLAGALIGGVWQMGRRQRTRDAAAAQATRVPVSVVRDAHRRALWLRVIGSALPAACGGLIIAWLTVPVVLAGLGWSM